jgi:hypothetical protein
MFLLVQASPPGLGIDPDESEFTNRGRVAQSLDVCARYDHHT